MKNVKVNLTPKQTAIILNSIMLSSDEPKTSDYNKTILAIEKKLTNALDKLGYRIA